MTKATRALEEAWKNGFQECFQKASQMLAKMCHCPKELLRSKRCLNRCKVTYLCCLINQFHELFEANIML
jgi:hypothetical protein